MKSAKILVYEDTTNIGYWVSDALDTLEGLDMSYPETTPKRRRELEAIRQQLTT